MEYNNQIVLVLGAWGSGTTAVTGILDRLGAYTCPPHFHTNDLHTQCSYESQHLRNILTHYISEQHLQIVGSSSRRDVVDEIQRWLNYVFDIDSIRNRVVALKHPLLSIILSELLPVLSPRLIFVQRAYEEIERTRIRRKWPAVYGKQGARILNKYVNTCISDNKVDVFEVEYKALLSRPDEYILKLGEYCNLDSGSENFVKARAFLRVR